MDSDKKIRSDGMAGGIEKGVSNFMSQLQSIIRAVWVLSTSRATRNSRNAARQEKEMGVKHITRKALGKAKAAKIAEVLG